MFEEPAMCGLFHGIAFVIAPADAWGPGQLADRSRGRRSAPLPRWNQFKIMVIAPIDCC
ncbi:hypothetical protein EMEDMD4_100075 [Sinorhizobium medicae]|uniref:Uncharacterized protein n=1 Tax=Sinorhizobium medicae TaxID=110321 RepID=A0A508WNF8_9HYPH|nr:hypothetical protein EMEDMD4_100075 [Sinorhizobium medicae]